MVNLSVPSRPGQRRRLLAWSGIAGAILLLMANLGAIIDALFHPEIEYFDPEHLIVGASSACVVGVLLVIIIVYTERLEQALQATRQTQAALRDSAEQINRLLQTTDQGIYGLDMAGRCTFINQAGAQLLRYTSAACLGQNMHHLIHHSRADGSPYPVEECPISRATMTGTGCRLDNEVLWRSDGTSFFAEYSAFPIVEQGEVQGAVVTFSDITARRQVEQALQDSELFVKGVLNSLTAHIAVLDAQGVIVAVNVAWQNFARDNGSPAGTDYLGVNYLAICEAAFQSGDMTASQVTPGLRAVLAGLQAQFSVEYPCNAPNQPRWFVLTVLPLHQSRPGAVVIHQDITERKLAEAALRESEQNYRTLADSGQALIWTADIDKLCRYFNSVWLAFTGRTLEQEAGDGWTAGIHPDDRRDCIATYHAAFERRQSFSMEYRLRRHDGEYRWLLDDGCPRYSSQGEFIGYIGHCLDITESKLAAQAEHAARQLAETLRDTATALNRSLNLDAVLDQVLISVERVIPHDGANIMLVNSHVARVARVHGRCTTETISTEQYPIATTFNLHRMQTTGEPCIIDHTRDNPDWQVWSGYEWIASYAGVPIGAQGELLGYLGLYSTQPGHFSSEHTQRLKMFSAQAALAIQNAQLHNRVQLYSEELEARVSERTAELQSVNVRLTELDHLKDEFLARISHELRTPLTNVKIYIELLETGKPEKRDRYLQTLKREAGKLHVLIEDVLLFSQLNLYTRPDLLSPINLNESIAGRLKAWQELAAGHDLQFQLDLTPNLPRTRTDDELIGQALNRLVTNAINYTPAGSVTVSTACADENEQRWITISIKDTGPGIAADEFPHIFERFYRGRVAADYKTPGTGIGLSISREIAEKLGGHLTVDTQVGAGSTFTLWLPAVNS